MKGEKGFTLIELLLVVMIIGLMLAVILPRGLRATTDAKYNLVRQNCAELAAYGNDWVEQQILAQDENSTATRTNYLFSLVRVVGGPNNSAWIAASGRSNWNTSSAPNIFRIAGRSMNGMIPGIGQFPDNSVEDIIEPAKMPRNPFNGGSVFLSSPMNLLTAVIPGAIACAVADDSSTGGTFDYYSFVFQGTDSTAFGPAPGTVAMANNGFHAAWEHAA